MKFEEFMVKLRENNYKFEDSTYFFRQKYLVQQEIVQPNLPKMKCCSEIFNPDLPFIQCRESNCKTYIHKSCFSKFALKICPNCSAKIDESTRITQINNMLDSKNKTIIGKEDDKFMGKKRERSDKQVTIINL